MGLVMSGAFDSIEEGSFQKDDGSLFNYLKIVVHDAANKSYDKITVSRPEDMAEVRKRLAGQEGKPVQFRVIIRDNGKASFGGFLPSA